MTKRDSIWVEEPGSSTIQWTWVFTYPGIHGGDTRVRLTVFDVGGSERGSARAKQEGQMRFRGHCSIGGAEIFRIYRATRRGACRALILGFRKFLQGAFDALDVVA